MPGGAAGDRPRISLCMMVRDEEAMLPAALASAAPWVDEMVVVDTGSSDGTVAVAEGFGARVFHHRWQGDFSLHRNQSISYARGQWLLILDADEELDQKSAPAMAGLLETDRTDCYLFEVRNRLPEGGFNLAAGPRLFRNLPGLRYDGRVHNRPRLTRPPLPAPVVIIHHGYALDPGAMRRKADQRLDMLRRWVREEPSEAPALVHLANSLLMYQGREGAGEARDLALAALELVRRRGGGPVELARAWSPALIALHQLGEHGRLLELAGRCAAELPLLPDPHFAVVMACSAAGRWQELARAAGRFLELSAAWPARPAAYQGVPTSTGGKEPAVLYHLARAQAHLGLAVPAADSLRALARAPGGAPLAQRLLEQLRGEGLAELAARLAPAAG